MDNHVTIIYDMLGRWVGSISTNDVENFANQLIKLKAELEEG
jgi:hypothetical protein